MTSGAKPDGTANQNRDLHLRGLTVLNMERGHARPASGLVAMQPKASSRGWVNATAAHPARDILGDLHDEK
jgi:hypothetical protein